MAGKGRGGGQHYDLTEGFTDIINALAADIQKEWGGDGTSNPLIEELEELYKKLVTNENHLFPGQNAAVQLYQLNNKIAQDDVVRKLFSGFHDSNNVFAITSSFKFVRQTEQGALISSQRIKNADDALYFLINDMFTKLNGETADKISELLSRQPDDLIDELIEVVTPAFTDYLTTELETRNDLKNPLSIPLLSVRNTYQTGLNKQNTGKMFLPKVVFDSSMSGRFKKSTRTTQRSVPLLGYEGEYVVYEQEITINVKYMVQQLFEKTRPISLQDIQEIIVKSSNLSKDYASNTQFFITMAEQIRKEANSKLLGEPTLEERCQGQTREEQVQTIKNLLRDKADIIIPNKINPQLMRLCLAIVAQQQTNIDYQQWLAYSHNEPFDTYPGDLGANTGASSSQWAGWYGEVAMGYIYDKFLKDIVGKNPRGEDPRGLQTGAITFTTGKQLSYDFIIQNMFGNIGIQVKNYTSENVDNTVSQFDYTDDTAEVFLNSRMQLKNTQLKTDILNFLAINLYSSPNFLTAERSNAENLIRRLIQYRAPWIMYVTREGEVRDKLFSVQDNLSTVWLINGHFILSSTIVASLLEALMAVLDNLDKPMTSNVISVRTTFHGTGDYLTYDAKNRKNLETILTTNVPKTAIHTHIRLDYGEIRRKYANEAILSHYM